MTAITTHVLDIARGRPAAGVPVVLERADVDERPQVVGRGVTDEDGRLRTLTDPGVALAPGVYRLTFDTRTYFTTQGLRPFHPLIVVTFEVASGEAHYHVPLLVSPFAYTTYRGS